MNEILERAKNLNAAVESHYLHLALTLAEISEAKLFREVGYGSYTEYVENELSRSKTFASNMLTVGKFLKENNYLPESVYTSYARLATSIRAHRDQDPQYILAAAQTNTEAELIQARQEKEAGEHECVAVCKHCKKLL